MFKFLPPANEVWGKVIFSVACVKNSVHREGVPAAGGCLLRGVPGRGVSPPGQCLVEGCLLPGSAWSQGGLVLGRCAWLRTPRTATSAGGTHPTGMHSCFFDLFRFRVCVRTMCTDPNGECLQ